MAKITIRVTNPIMLGLGAGKPRLKPGTHEIDESYLSKWYVKAMIADGTITIVQAPKLTPVDESKLTEVIIRPDSVEVAVPPAAPENEDVYADPRKVLAPVDFTPLEEKPKRKFGVKATDAPKKTTRMKKAK
jgi:hypothetical protein